MRTAIVVENYLLAQFNKSNGNKLKQVAFTKPLHVEYGSYGGAEGQQRRSPRYLNKFICKVQKSGQLAKIYKATEGAPLPPMPACKWTRRGRGRRLCRRPRIAARPSLAG